MELPLSPPNCGYTPDARQRVASRGNPCKQAEPKAKSSLDRTQEAAGSSPASSIAGIAPGDCVCVLAVRGPAVANFITWRRYPVDVRLRPRAGATANRLQKRRYRGSLVSTGWRWQIHGISVRVMKPTRFAGSGGGGCSRE